MDEDLLGYLLAALEPHEMREVEERLRVDPEAREELARIERSLRPLDESREENESPPPDLIARTLASLPPLPPAGEVGSEGESDPASRGDLMPADKLMPADNGGGDFVTLSPLRSGIETPSGTNRGWLDWFAGAVASAILLGLLLPALAEGRFEARKIACQDQLRQFGSAITQFVLRDESERLPAVAERGPEAFAGIYAVRLNDAGLLPDPSLRWCPSVWRPDWAAGSAERPSDSCEWGGDPGDWSVASGDGFPFESAGKRGRVTGRVAGADRVEPAGRGNRAGRGGHGDRGGRGGRVVSAAALSLASVNRLKELQRLSGGHYAYTLGVVDGRRYRSPRYQGRTSFAVMSDAPLGGDPRSGVDASRLGHGGRGINVLYESGRVRFVPVDAIETIPDHPLLNMRGDVEAGVNIDDAVLGPSWRGPFLDAPQR